MQREFAAGRIGFDAIRPRIMSWIGHARQANTYRLRTDLFRRIRSSGRRPNPRLLRGGSFNNQPANVRSANRNRNAPTNRNNNNGFRPASTLRREAVFRTARIRRRLSSRSVRCKVQVVVPCRAGQSCPAKRSIGPAGLVGLGLEGPAGPLAGRMRLERFTNGPHIQ